MANLFIMLGSIGAGLAVALGAFGAHGLEGKLTERFMQNFQTGVQYQMYHSLGLLAIGILASKAASTSMFVWAGWLMVVGIILFSGSLYVLSLTGITKLGAITPLGGVAFIAGWVLLAIAAVKSL
ncbi:DUF423 domain-containing protein [Desertibacillus haloalkaliphilus]|uniref:DUF423 domain-containing protein n=1 Tax=Desertibacillus haloalkaliphilus TaxID=1328930 RepID=UPI001C277226|nr:DUF423 domain-containing protein [Desertibacillus haloalkaliphilus]MBU8905825.1 DUF423 domain-containing protein [Desertibacillus haloalkaliphilus]